MLLPLTLAVPPAPGPGAARAPRAAGQHHITRVRRSSMVSAPASAIGPSSIPTRHPEAILLQATVLLLLLFNTMKHHEAKKATFFDVVGIGSTPAPHPPPRQNSY
jgi:hypothetical protein